jgi:ribonuclease VapC
MIVDTSAVIAILQNEPETRRFLDALSEDNDCRLSAATYLEAAIVVDSVRNPVLSRRLDELIHSADIRIEPLTEAQAKIAREAYRDFGKGSGHPAQLNFGDCFAYALAQDSGEPLLFKGNDFSQTDVRSALRQSEPN